MIQLWFCADSHSTPACVIDLLSLTNPGHFQQLLFQQVTTQEIKLENAAISNKKQGLVKEPLLRLCKTQQWH